MPIVGGRITKLEAERIEDNVVKSLEYGFNIDSVKMDKKIIVVDYTTTINYTPSVARIVVKGQVFIEEEEKRAKEIMDLFKAEKRLPDGVTEEVVTGMNFAASAVGTLAAFGIGINAPLQIPRARVMAPPAGAMPVGGSGQKAKAG